MREGPGGAESPEMESVEAALATVREAVRALAAEIRVLREDPLRPAGVSLERVATLTERCEQLAEENRGLRKQIESRALSAGAQADLLANLYVAAFQLHRSLDFQELLDSIKEILINLIGAERFLIYAFDSSQRRLRLVADESPDGPPPSRLLAAEGIVGVVAKTGIPYFDSTATAGDVQNPRACVPMKADGEVVGVIQVNQLFVQKQELTTQDHELFSLLAEHAGTALLAASLYRRWRSARIASGDADAAALLLDLTDGGTLAPGPNHGSRPEVPLPVAGRD